jgi:uncharacterized protein (TIGR00251 family)
MNPKPQPTTSNPHATTTIGVKVVPGSSRDRVVGRYGDALKVQVSAAPERGKANAAVGKLLAEFFGVKESQVELVNGAGSPRKQFRISGLDDAAIQAKLDAIP